MRIFWLVLGCISVALGVIGIALPIMPTVPFLILAAFSFARSSERLHNWIVTHETFGPPIVDWQERGVIARRTKWLATASILASLVFPVLLAFPVWLITGQAAVLALIIGFIWSRPDR